MPEHAYSEGDWATIFKVERVRKKARGAEIELPEPEKNLRKGLKVGDSVGDYGVYMGDRGVYSTRNILNDLTGKEWVLFTKSWFIHNPPARKETEKLHPAKFPEGIIADFIRFFTKKGQLVLDPMVGTGSTLVACDMAMRRGVGVELIHKWVTIARERTTHVRLKDKPEQLVIEGDANNLLPLLTAHGISQVDFCITSPPYWNMLKKSRGHVNSESHKREASGLEVYYSDHPNDLGNIEDYDEYIEALYRVYAKVYEALREGGYLTIIVQNIRTPDGEMIPFAWDLARKLSTLYVLKQEKIWAQDNKMLGCWGYPSEYVSNVHHHYCLVFKKDTARRKRI